MKKIQWFSLAVVLTTAVVVYFIGDKLLAHFKLSIKNMEFKYIEDSKKTQRWIYFMTPLAKSVGALKGIPWQFIVVQTALETGWGKSSLFQKYNNFGGIKDDGKPPFVSLPTKECNSGGCYNTTAKFEVWATKYDGLMYYADFFHRNKRYAQALKYPNDPYKFADEVAKAGYATAPNYAATLKTMLNKYFA